LVGLSGSLTSKIMNKSERAKYIHKKLNKIYPKILIPLNHKNKFELLVAVLLSAQCTDERVNQVTPVLFKKANNPLLMKKNTIEYNIQNHKALWTRAKKIKGNL
jgi:endonuclease III